MIFFVFVSLQISQKYFSGRKGYNYNFKRPINHKKNYHIELTSVLFMDKAKNFKRFTL